MDGGRIRLRGAHDLDRIGARSIRGASMGEQRRRLRDELEAAIAPERGGGFRRRFGGGGKSVVSDAARDHGGYHREGGGQRGSGAASEDHTGMVGSTHKTGKITFPSSLKQMQLWRGGRRG